MPASQYASTYLGKLVHSLLEGVEELAHAGQSSEDNEQQVSEDVEQQVSTVLDIGRHSSQHSRSLAVTLKTLRVMAS